VTDDISRSETRVLGFEDPELDYQLLRQLGSANSGGATVGEALGAAAAIRQMGQGSWVPTFAELAERQRVRATECEAAGHRVSAAEQYLLACNSYRAAEYFAHVATDEHRRLGRASEEAFARSLDLAGVRYERLKVSVDGMSLPGYWFGTDQDRGGVLVAVSGFDGTTEETYLQYGRGAAARGWQLLLIAGPGQADTNRAYPDKPFVPDTERWISPWIDVALTRPGVDPERIALLGISYGGYFVLRAAAADPRVRAVVANSPIIDLRWYVTSFVGFDPEEALTADDDFGLDDIDQIPDSEIPPTSKDMVRMVIKRFGQDSFLRTFRYLREFSVDPVAVKCPALAMVGEGEGPNPLAQHERFLAEAGGPVTSRVFTKAEGADAHCQLSNLPLSNQVLYDWLDDTLPAEDP
jgi:pimeloyl-ACP methyl ester carboxylesterase